MANQHHGGKHPNQDGKHQQQKKNKEAISHALSGLGIGATGFQHLVDMAVRNDWPSQRFLEELKTSKRFQRMFPGLVVQGGQINPFLGNSLAQAVGNYRKIAFTYKQTARGLFNLSDRMIGEFIQKGISPDEFGTRIEAIAKVKSNPGLMDIYNQELKAMGRSPLDEIGFLKFTAGAASRDFYDIYEASYLRSQGLNIDANQALGVAKAIGTPGQMTDLSQLLSDVYRFKNDIQPELDRNGITDSSLALLAAGGGDPALTPVLQGLVAQKRATGTQVPGYQTRRGTGGGAAYQPDEEPTSF